MRHGERPDHGLGGAFPPPAGRVAETRGASRGVKECFRGVNRPEAPWRQNRVLAYCNTLDPPSDYVTLKFMISVP